MRIIEQVYYKQQAAVRPPNELTINPSQVFVILAVVRRSV